MRTESRHAEYVFRRFISSNENGSTGHARLATSRNKARFATQPVSRTTKNANALREETLYFNGLQTSIDTAVLTEKNSEKLG